MAVDVPRPRKPSWLKRIIMTVVTVVIVGTVFFYVLPRFASYHEVFNALGDLKTWQLVSLVAMAVFNLACAWTMYQASLPGMKNWQAAQLALSQNLISSTLPLGGAWSLGLGYGIIHSYGFNAADFGMMMGVSGIWNILVKFALPVAAVLLLLFSGNGSWSTVTLALIGVAALLGTLAVLALVLWKPSLARRTGDLAGRAASWFLHYFHKGPVTTWGSALVDFREQTLGVARRRWLTLTVVAVLYQLTTFWVYLMALRYSGVPSHGGNSITWVSAFAIFALVRLISAIPITPGALGVAEASYTSLLIADGGGEAQVVAGILLFRGLTYLMPIILGLPAYLSWLIRQRRKRRADPTEDP